jgi:hypothetical protein
MAPPSFARSSNAKSGPRKGKSRAPAFEFLDVADSSDEEPAEERHKVTRIEARGTQKLTTSSTIIASEGSPVKKKRAYVEEVPDEQSDLYKPLPVDEPYYFEDTREDVELDPAYRERVNDIEDMPNLSRTRSRTASVSIS